MTNALSWSLVSFIMAIIAAVLAFGGVLAPDQGGISRVVFFLSLICFVVFLVIGLMGPRRLDVDDSQEKR